MNVNELDGFINSLGRLSALQHIADLKRELRGLLTKECGNCDHWMKTIECPLEARGEKPSMSHWPCSKFSQKASLITLFNKRLTELDARLVALKKESKP